MADQNKGMSDLWRRLRFVFMAIVVYRLGTHIPIPGIDPARLAALFDQNQTVTVEDTPSNRGMINKIRDMLEVIES